MGWLLARLLLPAATNGSDCPEVTAPTPAELRVGWLPVQLPDSANGSLGGGVEGVEGLDWTAPWLPDAGVLAARM